MTQDATEPPLVEPHEEALEETESVVTEEKGTDSEDFWGAEKPEIPNADGMVEHSLSEEIAVGEVEVSLSFQVGSQKMALMTLETLQPGYLFTLEAAVDDPLTIRANGKVIGRGKLVDIDGKIGVVVTEMNNDSSVN